jgi:hypothetical protein
MVAFHALEQAVVSGQACRELAAAGRAAERAATDGRVNGAVDVRLTEPVSEPRRAWLIMLGSLSQWLESGRQMSAETQGFDGGRQMSAKTRGLDGGRQMSAETQGLDDGR